MKKRRLLLLTSLTALATFGVTMLLVNIMERKQEASNPFFRVVEVTDDTTDPAVWGENFPLQYDAYLRTVDQVRTRYGGSEAVRQIPTDADPRDVTSQSKLEADPRLVKMWAGYAFSTDFREERGHAYMLIDQRFTRRVTEFNQPGTCLNCHASTYVAMKELGGGDIFSGFEQINQMTYAEATKLVEHPVSCIDCHDPETMSLRITRPAFIEGISNYMALQGVADYDVNEQASAQQMRTYVCAQCHIEYYFQGAEKRLVFPWHEGLTVDAAYSYYEKVGHTDFVHAESGANALKAQHPEFETYSQGVHARSGVACADCHMAYKREGGMKISDHHVSSPLLGINRACQGCHHFSEEEMLARVEQIQDRYRHALDVAFDGLINLIDDIVAAQREGVTDDRLAAARGFQRKAQFFIDYCEAENSSGFHAPGESLRILNDATEAVRQGHLALRGVSFPAPLRVSLE